MRVELVKVSEKVPNSPEGFRYIPELIVPDDEDRIIARVRALPFRDFEFHGYMREA